MTPTADLLAEPPPDEPLALVGRWLADAMQRRLQPNPNAMVLATTGADGHPSARVVLLKAHRKAGVPRVLYQLRIKEGAGACRLAARGRRHALGSAAAPGADHRARRAFAARRERCLLRIASLAPRVWLPGRVSKACVMACARRSLRQGAAARRFGTPNPADPPKDGADYAIARPPHWGGYRLWAENVELWQEGKSRIHDRFLWSRQLAPARAPKTLSPDPGPLRACSPDRCQRKKNEERVWRRKRCG